jgi:hypothetical protein
MVAIWERWGMDFGVFMIACVFTALFVIPCAKGLFLCFKFIRWFIKFWKEYFALAKDKPNQKKAIPPPRMPKTKKKKNGKGKVANSEYTMFYQQGGNSAERLQPQRKPGRQITHI